MCPICGLTQTLARVTPTIHSWIGMTTTPCCSTSTASSPRRPSCTSMRGRRCSPSTSRAQGIEPPYSDADYFAYVDGKPRYDGVRSLLASRGVELPEGDPATRPTRRPYAASGTARTKSSRRSWPRRSRALSRLGGSDGRAGGRGRRDGSRVELQERPGSAGRSRDRAAGSTSSSTARSRGGRG